MPAAGTVRVKSDPLTAAFQGERGAFSEQAVKQFLGDTVSAVPLTRFDDVFRALSQGQVNTAVIPIENTLHGSVHENYDHLIKYDLVISAETNLRIVHNLIALSGVTFSKIRRVFSHPVALAQCLNFFEQFPHLERVPFYDTAGSVKMIVAEQLRDAAAIASAVAAANYDAKILKRSIEDDRRNFTRFFLLHRTADAPAPPPNHTKMSVVFTTRNIPGALFRSLSAFALRDINLTKIESRPLRGKPWEYLFYLDFLGHSADPNVQKALGHLAELADFFRVLGCYPKA